MGTEYVISIKVQGSESASGPLGAVGGALGRIAEFVSAGVIFRGLEQIGRGLESAAGAGFNAATAFETVMSRIKGLTTTPTADLAKMSDDIIRLSKTLNISANELGEAEYFIASSGFAGKQATDILTASAKAASAGLGQTKTIADAVTSALNAYKLKAGDAARITDVLTRAVIEGKGEPDALAAAIARVLPIAAQAGVSFEQVMASLATMTRTGLSAEEAATALRGTLGALIAPSKEAKEALGKLGFSTDDLRNMIKNKGLMQTLTDLVNKSGETTLQYKIQGDEAKSLKKELEKLRDENGKITAELPFQQEKLAILNRELTVTTEKYGITSIQADQKCLAIARLTQTINDETATLASNNLLIDQRSKKLGEQVMVEGDVIETMDKIIPNIRALTGVLSTASSQADAYAEVLASMGKATGSVDRAFAASAGTWEFQFGRFKNVLLAMPIELGEKVLPGLTGILDGITKDISGKTSGWADLVAGWLGPTIGRLQTAAQTGGIQGVMAEIGKMIDEGWTNSVQPQLQTWATAFWDWLTGANGATSTAGANIATFVSSISGEMLSPGNLVKLQTSFFEWQNKMWDWLTAGLENFSKFISQGVAKLNEWVNSSEGQAKLEKVSQDLSGLLMTGMEQSFKNATRMGEILSTLAFTMGTAVAKIDWIPIGSSIANGISMSIMKSLPGMVQAGINAAGPTFLLGAFSTGGVFGPQSNTTSNTTNQTIYGGVNVNHIGPANTLDLLGALVP